MPHKIYYHNDFILDDHLQVRMRDSVQIIVNGDFSIRGTIDCPGQHVEVYIAGSGVLWLKGNCKTFSLMKVDGNCIIDTTGMNIGEMVCRGFSGKSLVKTRCARITGKTQAGPDVIFLQQEAVIPNRACDHARPEVKAILADVECTVRLGRGTCL